MQARLGDRLARCRCRSKAHDVRVIANYGLADNAQQRLDTQRIGLFSAHDHHGSSTVVDAGRIGRSHRPTILEGRFHPGQIFHGDAKTGMLILGKLFDLLAGPDFQRQDFVNKLARLDRRFGLLLTRQGKGVLILAGNVELFGNIFSSHTVWVRSHRPRQNRQQTVFERLMPEFVAKTMLTDVVRQHVHVFSTAGDDDVRFIGLNSLYS